MNTACLLAMNLSKIITEFLSQRIFGGGEGGEGLQSKGTSLEMLKFSTFQNYWPRGV